MNAFEINFDGIVGPTHHYGGLSPGNLASQEHRLRTSYPKQAALEGLQKMKLLMELGIPQAVLPPHERPCLPFLRDHGFLGSDAEVVNKALHERPDLLSIASSASAMWAANAATVSPSADCRDGKLHITPANLISTTHRRLEPEFTTALLRRIFSDSSLFQIHDPLPDDPYRADEGAANHSRMCRHHEDSAVEVFVYGRHGAGPLPQKYPARQTRAAGEWISRQHGLDDERVLFIQQYPPAIDAGVFHNDVICVVNQNVMFCHEKAYVDQRDVIEQLREKLPELYLIQVSTQELSIEEAVQTYLFNSQLVTLAEQSMFLLCPIECAEHEKVQRVLDRVKADDNPIDEIHYIDVRQSMQNGGGPACLRLRVVLTQDELAAIHQPVLLTDELYGRLIDWVDRHYRDELTIESLGDPALIDEVRNALDELSGILELGAIYSFQR